MYSQATVAYKTTNVMTTDPNKLILMLYEGGIKFLLLTRKGILENNKVMRGENLHRVIGIVTELFSSVEGETEQAMFLRGLYNTMLTELAKVNLTNDLKTVELSIKYLAQLKNIWEQEVMVKASQAQQVQQAQSDAMSDDVEEKVVEIKQKAVECSYAVRASASSSSYTYVSR